MFKYRNKVVNDQDIIFIKDLIAKNPGTRRWELSRKLRLEWNWVQPNGNLCDMICRGLMLELHRAGHIQLPDKKHNPKNPFEHRQKPTKIEIDQSSLHTKLSNRYF